MRPILAFAVVAITVCLLLRSTDPVSGQASGGDDCGPISLCQPLDLKVMHSCFSQSSFKSAVESALDSEECTHVSFTFFEEQPNGDRDYGGCLLFHDSGSNYTKYGPDYTYDSSRGSTPEVPLDTMSYTTTTETGSYSGAAIPDKVCWRFLLHVTNPVNTPDELYDEFDNKDLVRVSVTRYQGKGLDQVAAHFKYASPNKTWHVIADHTGNYNFGPLTVEAP